MTPCRNNRKLIALMAADVLEARHAQTLQAHLKTCEGCRLYLTQISHVTDKLATSRVTPGLEASEQFHQRIVRSIRADLAQSSTEKRTAIKSWFAGFHGTGAKRTALALGGSLGVAVGLFVLMTSSQHSPIATDSSPANTSRAAASPQPASLLIPTLSNYRKAVNGSPEKLEELLTLQSSGHSSSLPILTAATLPSQTDPD
jgi:hypothetical protein